MKKLLLALCAAFASLSPTYSQCMVSPSSQGTTFAYGVTDSITPTQSVASPFIACDNSSIYYYGNSPDTIFLEGSAHLKIGACWNLVVYMRNNCRLEIDTTISASQRQIAHIYFDPAFTTFQDTAGTNILAMTSCPGLSYTYSNFPNSQSPCALPTGAESREIQAFEVYPNPATEGFNISISEEKALVEIMGYDGRLIDRRTIQRGDSRIQTTDWPKGLYLVRVSAGKASATRKLMVR